jgi:hypothetical protein
MVKNLAKIYRNLISITRRPPFDDDGGGACCDRFVVHDQTKELDAVDLGSFDGEGGHPFESPGGE